MCVPQFYFGFEYILIEVLSTACRGGKEKIKHDETKIK